MLESEIKQKPDLIEFLEDDLFYSYKKDTITSISSRLGIINIVYRFLIQFARKYLSNL
jgi:hypothetical protein